jgi:hypothetical protein
MRWYLITKDNDEFRLGWFNKVRLNNEQRHGWRRVASWPLQPTHQAVTETIFTDSNDHTFPFVLTCNTLENLVH